MFGLGCVVVRSGDPAVVAVIISPPVFTPLRASSVAAAASLLPTSSLPLEDLHMSAGFDAGSCVSRVNTPPGPPPPLTTSISGAEPHHPRQGGADVTTTSVGFAASSVGVSGVPGQRAGFDADAPRATVERSVLSHPCRDETINGDRDGISGTES